MRSTIRSLFPILTWLPRYQSSWLQADLIAGLAVWAMTVPQVLAYAAIAGVPPLYALYTVPLAMAAYAVFGTSRTLSVGPESAIAIVSAATVGALVAGDSAEYLALTSLLALVVGALFLLFGLLRLGWLAHFLAQPVLQGFTQGIALTVILSQLPLIFGTTAPVKETVGELRNLPQVLGLDVAYTGILLQGWAVLKTLGAAHLATTAIGVASLVLLFAFRRFRPYAPSALIAVVLAVGAVTLLGLEQQGVSVIGEVETGMVAISLPAISMQKVVSLLPGAFAIVLLGYSVSLSVAAVGARRTGETIDPSQELVGLGMGNIGAALSSGFVVCGSLSRGSVINRGGGKTQVVSLVNAGLVILTLLFALPLFFKLPMATLAAIVVVAMSGLLDFGYFRKLLRVDRQEFAYGMAALLGVLLLGIMPGVAVGVVLALVLLIAQVTRPNYAVLGRMPGTDVYRDLETHSDAESVPGLLIFRADGPVIFPNAAALAARIRQLVGDSETPVRELLLPAQQINHLDSTGADQLTKLAVELEEQGISLSLAGAKNGLRESIRRTGLEARVGAERFYESIDEGVQAFLQPGGAKEGG